MVKQVAAPVANDPWETNETSLMSMDCDSGAQCSLLRGPPPVRPLTWRDHPILTDKSILLNGRWKTVFGHDAEFGKGRL